MGARKKTLAGHSAKALPLPPPVSGTRGVYEFFLHGHIYLYVLKSSKL